MDSIINFNGTIEGLGGPLIGWSCYTKVLFVYYRKGTVYVKPKVDEKNRPIFPEIEPEKREQKIGQKQTQETERITLDSSEDIKKAGSAAPISKVEVRYIRQGSKLDYASFFPIGLVNNVANIVDDTILSAYSDVASYIPATIKPILVKQEQLNSSSTISKEKRNIEDKNDNYLKETGYYSVSQKNNTLSVQLFSVKNNFLLEILQARLDSWLSSNQGNQNYNNMVEDESKEVFKNYVPYPNENEQWEVNDRYIIQKMYIDKAAPAYLFTYISDNIFIRRAKLVSYNFQPRSNGDGIDVTINFEKLVSEEQAYIYEQTPLPIEETIKKEEEKEASQVSGNFSLLDDSIFGNKQTSVDTSKRMTRIAWKTDTITNSSGIINSAESLINASQKMTVILK